jgi:acetyl-CoA C-acetyltransferase
MMADRAAQALIIDGVRTPRGKAKGDGALHEFHPQELLAQTLNALSKRTSFDVNEIEDAIIGCASGSGDHDMCIGRLALIAAAWPDRVPGLTVNRYCGSGQQAVNLAAMAIASGEHDLLVAGGVELMSRYIPSGQTMDAGNLALRAHRMLVTQGVSADLMATLGKFTPEELDTFAKRSHDRATEAQAKGFFKRSLISVRKPDGTLALAVDEAPRTGVTMEALAALKPSFAAAGAALMSGFPRTQDEACIAAYPEIKTVNHLHHPGNSSGRSDGASAMLMASPRFARDAGMKPRARIRRTAVLGGDPITMLAVPPDVSRLCLDRAGMRVEDIDLWEINEAFAVVPLHTARKLNIDPDRINVNGGGIALGHPIGATGPMLIQTALDELERRDLNTALITMCTGAGMATATIIERV